MSRRRAAIVAVLVLSVTLSLVLAWRALPRVARWAVTRQVEAATGRPLTIGRFDLDLTQGKLLVSDARLGDRARGRALAEIDRLEVRFKPLSIFGRELRIDEAALAGIRVHIARDERGVLSIADLLEKPTTASRAAVTLGRLTIKDAAIDLEDRALPPVRTWRVEGIAVEATNL